MPGLEFDTVKCHSVRGGTEGDFYHWATNLHKEPWSARANAILIDDLFKIDPWEIRTEDIQGNKFLLFHWHNIIGRGDDFEVSMMVDLEKGQYDVCDVVPLMGPRMKPCEYNECLERFVHDILDRYNRDNKTSALHVVYTTCCGHLTYEGGFNLADVWTEKDTEYMEKTFIREIYRSRLELMEDVLNRHNREIISRESHAAVSHQIVEIITQQLLRPGDCDLMMAAQCFAGMCMKKMAPTDMFDEFMTDEYRAQLSKLIGVDSWRLEGAIQIGAVRTNFYSLYDEGVRNGTEH